MNQKETIKYFVLHNYFFSDDLSVVQDDQSFLESGIIDSIGVMEIVMFIEGEFSINVLDEEIAPENLDSINKIDAFVTAKLSSQV